MAIFKIVRTSSKPASHLTEIKYYAILLLEGERMLKIIVTKRTDDYHACLENRPDIWGCGKSTYEAIGNLINTHQRHFNVAVEYAGIERMASQ